MIEKFAGDCRDLHHTSNFAISTVPLLPEFACKPSIEAWRTAQAAHLLFHR
jgi:hypothetical protein